MKELKNLLKSIKGNHEKNDLIPTGWTSKYGVCGNQHCCATSN